METFPLSSSEEGLKIRDLIKNRDRRLNLMKHLSIKPSEPVDLESPSKISTKVAKTVLTPTRKSPGGRAKGLEAIFAKQKLPKSVSASSLSLKRLQTSQWEENDDDKDDVLSNHLSSTGGTNLSNSSVGVAKVRKITKL